MIGNKKKYNKGNVAEDAEIALEAELKAIDILNLAFPNTLFESVHDDKELWHTGDVRMTGRGFIKYMDIKDDGCIYYTGNVFCENYKYYHSSPNKKAKGFMRSSKYDLLGVFDDVKKKLYILDFRRLKQIYENYKIKKSHLSDCNSYGNCVPLRECKKHNALVFEIKFKDTDDNLEILDVINYRNKEK